jgi:hypothetical protein
MVAAKTAEGKLYFEGESLPYGVNGVLLFISFFF